MVNNGSFREDLLYRMNTIHIEIPPLRERGNDIKILASFYLNKYANKYNKPGITLTKEGLETLMSYHWPGNVRELQHSIEKAIILCEGKSLSSADFTLRNESLTSTSIQSLTLDEMEKQLILSHMKKENGNLSNVAKNLGITRQTLYNKLKRYDI